MRSPHRFPLESTRKCWESTLYCDRGQTLEQQGQMVEREKEEEEKEMEEKEMEEKQIQEQKKEYFGNFSLFRFNAAEIILDNMRYQRYIGQIKKCWVSRKL